MTKQVLKIVAVQLLKRRKLIRTRKTIFELSDFKVRCQAVPSPSSARPSPGKDGSPSLELVAFNVGLSQFINEDDVIFKRN